MITAPVPSISSCFSYHGSRGAWSLSILLMAILKTSVNYEEWSWWSDHEEELAGTVNVNMFQIVRGIPFWCAVFEGALTLLPYCPASESLRLHAAIVTIAALSSTVGTAVSFIITQWFLGQFTPWYWDRLRKTVIGQLFLLVAMSVAAGAKHYASKQLYDLPGYTFAMPALHIIFVFIEVIFSLTSVVTYGQSSYELKHKRFQVLETVAVTEDLRSQRPFGPLSELKAYLVAGVLGIKSPKPDDTLTRSPPWKYRLEGKRCGRRREPAVQTAQGVGSRAAADEPRRSQWLNAVPMIRRQKKEPEKLMLCSLHFSPSESDYEYNPALGKALGVPKRGVLSRSAVPSSHSRHRCPCRSKPASR
ncbi:hypothetical protein HPB52_018296 [Rhipicephalus sanguineus]|uniref:THAP-type domain-containing protein n=1 Tax=Rhipicephalus sanguineus TaxID=34632 RepID=A0A9D4PJH4_RHISA|nr:hypothetical protein HPB52_018296 [Rhipicephalus sanguineus]